MSHCDECGRETVRDAECTACKPQRLADILAKYRIEHAPRCATHNGAHRCTCGLAEALSIAACVGICEVCYSAHTEGLEVRCLDCQALTGECEQCGAPCAPNRRACTTCVSDDDDGPSYGGGQLSDYMASRGMGVLHG